MNYLSNTSAAKVYDAASRYCEAEMLLDRFTKMPAVAPDEPQEVVSDVIGLTNKIFNDIRHNKRLIIMSALAKVAKIARDPNIDNTIISTDRLFAAIIDAARNNWSTLGRKSSQAKAAIVQTFIADYMGTLTSIDATESVWGD